MAQTVNKQPEVLPFNFFDNPQNSETSPTTLPIDFFDSQFKKDAQRTQQSIDMAIKQINSSSSLSDDAKVQEINKILKGTGRPLMGKVGI